MVRSEAESVDEYLDELEPDRKEAIAAIREVVLRNLPPGYEETMRYGMISYVIPLERYPVTYNKQPLGYAAIASHKSYISLYLMNIYGDAEAETWFSKRYKATGKKLDMGKSCVHFKKLDDVPLELVGEAIARTSADEFIERYETSRAGTKRR